ncbi:Ig mu chain C region secreted form [Heracleum sosnowskyi]|uniref:Ig mu chain C region secreted form n=1 Tax=Heracleum sosnowskyi TaxID=360622 RepID=A0AAD8JIW3_9APIA|nr:Ig mu chain C region secreted form [Heracleum sosnowskyi]
MDNQQQQQEALKADNDSPPPSFIQVVCKSSGKIRRFAPGTDAAFALNLINKRLLLHNPPTNSTPPLASHIEAVKLGFDSEEPVSFGPTATLFNYGPPWILQTVVDTQSHTPGPAKGEGAPKSTKHSQPGKGSEGYRSAKKTSQPLGIWYISKILLALLMIFAIGATFTLVLENLPALLLYINSNM